MPKRIEQNQYDYKKIFNYINNSNGVTKEELEKNLDIHNQSINIALLFMTKFDFVYIIRKKIGYYNNLDNKNLYVFEHLYYINKNYANV